MKKLIEIIKAFFIRLFGKKKVEVPILLDSEIKAVKTYIEPVKLPDIENFIRNPRGTTVKTNHRKSTVWQKEKRKAKMQKASRRANRV